MTPERLQKIEAGLRLIKSMGDKTLIGPGIDDECDRAYSLGANAAFAQVAGIAESLLAEFPVQ